MPLRRLLAEMGVLGLLILVLAVLGPFGSYATPIGPRLLHWALYLVTGYVFFRPVIAGGGALSRQTGLPRFAAIAMACALGAFPTSLMIVVLSAGSAWPTITAATLASAYAQTLIIGATVTAVQLLARQAPAPSTSPPASPSPAVPPPALAASTGRDAADVEAPLRPAPAFLELLPAHLRGEILCLENEDHYVRVHTEHGSAMILMRMRDAAAQLEGMGARVHRSWWVARAAVTGTLRHERNLKLRLKDGREVPVARANVPELRALGWLSEARPLQT